MNGRPATAPSVAYALREAYPRRPGDVKPATILFISLPPTDVDVNVHPTKREVRFRDNVAVKQAIVAAIDAALAAPVAPSVAAAGENDDLRQPTTDLRAGSGDNRQPTTDLREPPPVESRASQVENPSPLWRGDDPVAPMGKPLVAPAPPVAPAPVQQEITIETSSDGESSKPWRTFRYLAQTDTGYLLIETDSGLVTINPIAARERLAYEKLLAPYRDAASPYRGASSPEQPSEATQPQAAGNSPTPLSQALLIPETVRLSPVDFARLNAARDVVRAMGFQIEEFGTNVFKIDAVPQLLGTLSPADVLATIAHDLSEVGAKRGDRWREELIAKSIARSFAGAPMKLTEEGATKLVEELCRARMPYVCPRGKPVMIFTSTRELNRKFDRD